MNLATLEQLVAKGESETLELKRSTAELRRAGESLCAFLNSEGGRVVIGVAPDGRSKQRQGGRDQTETSLPSTCPSLARLSPRKASSA